MTSELSIHHVTKINLGETNVITESNGDTFSTRRISITVEDGNTFTVLMFANSPKDLLTEPEFKLQDLKNQLEG